MNELYRMSLWRMWRYGSKILKLSEVGKPQREVDDFRDELETLRRALGARIRHLRKLRAWSQEEFAAMAHVHRTFAGSLERGEKNCSFHVLALISRCFGVTMSELLVGVEKRQSTSSVSAPAKSRRAKTSADLSEALRELATLEQNIRRLQRLLESALARPHGHAVSKLTGRG
jgi:transcriptional regulator with XRE-family HTH domain